MNRILFFVHYNKYGGLLEYVIYLLQHIRHIYNRIVFVSNSPLSDTDRSKLDGLFDSLHIRDNKGFDFGAWKDAILLEGWEILSKYDNLTIMNDSCFGPLFDLQDIYLKMERDMSIDFWGLTNCLELKEGLADIKEPIPEHIQSYFICFNKAVVNSLAFRDFWNEVRYEEELITVVSKYETQLTRVLSNSGFKYRIFADTRIHEEIKSYITYNHPYYVIFDKVPLLKIKAFVYFEYPMYLTRLLKGQTSYPVSLIHDYYNKMYSPNVAMFIENKTIVTRANTVNRAPLNTRGTRVEGIKPYGADNSCGLKAAIHLHVFFLDVFAKYIEYFDIYGINIDIFITTDTDDKKAKIEEAIKNHVMGLCLKKIIVVDNLGRDIIPLLAISGTLKSYDIVGHFHTKKSSHAPTCMGAAWQEELLNLLLFNYKEIFEVFYNNMDIGIVVSEIPYHFRYVFPLRFSNEKIQQKEMQNLWHKMNCKKIISFMDIETAIMPVGTMFWFRPNALRPLFELEFDDNELPLEPLPIEDTIYNCIERMMVYIAWNENYDYRIMVNDEYIMSAFSDNITLNRQYIQSNLQEQQLKSDNITLSRQYTQSNLREEQLRNSITFRVGKFILFLPKLIKFIIKRFSVSKIN
ncbi:MAG: rhamnose-glucose polysaccharide assembly protein RgpF [Termitinemataceae bacterium]|nr:MAG: rhamnose-glucose polysaccharide assembly protein RgpF [Termitinemataceae bacterium]